MRLKDITILSPQYIGDKIDCDVSFVPMESLRNGNIDYQTIPFNQAKGKYTYFGNNDLLIAKVTPCFENGNIAIAKNLLNGIGYGSSEIFVLRPNEKLISQYLFYLSQSRDFQNKACATMCGVGGLKRISPLFMRTYEVNIPNLKAQERMVNYLDTKLYEINTQVSLLTSKRNAYLRLKKSIINHAVTQGLNPEVKMKANGVDWIGEIPEHWEYKRIKDISRQVFMGKTPEYTFKKNKNWIFGQRNNQTYGLDFNDIKYGKDAFFSSRKKFEFLKYGDVLLNTLGGGSVGRVGFYNYKGVEKVITDGHIMVIRCKGYSEKYLYYFLSTKRNALEQMAVGSTNQSFFNISDILILHVPFPPLSEQQAIAAYLDEKCSKIDKIVANLEKQISLYTDMKRSLIDEVITGKRAV